MCSHGVLASEVGQCLLTPLRTRLLLQGNEITAEETPQLSPPPRKPWQLPRPDRHLTFGSLEPGAGGGGTSSDQ